MHPFVDVHVASNSWWLTRPDPMQPGVHLWAIHDWIHALRVGSGEDLSPSELIHRRNAVVQYLAIFGAMTLAGVRDQHLERCLGGPGLPQIWPDTAIHALPNTSIYYEHQRLEAPHSVPDGTPWHHHLTAPGRAFRARHPSPA
jgi:hypothetical protein